MEKNNGSEQVTIKELIDKADPQVKELVNALVNRVNLLENNWMQNRVEYLFKILDCKEFNSIIKAKAVEELEAFLFPKVEPKTEE